MWALDILAEEGFQTDSSIYPIHHDCYGVPDAQLTPHLIATTADPVFEFPGMVCQVGRMNVPVGGGGYLRLLPWSVTRRALHRVRRHGRPLNVYIHPWEFDPEQPRIQAGWKSRFRHYQNLQTTDRKVRALLTEFRLGRMTDVLQEFSGTAWSEHRNCQAVQEAV
jgi:polysaccharide deacetylase family protein (PEP-CTERM system associated)